MSNQLYKIINIRIFRAIIVFTAMLTVSVYAESKYLPKQQVNVTVYATQVSEKISPHWFGSGAEHYDQNIALALRTPQAMNAIRKMGMGFLRFPHGTSAQYYFWDKPKQSYTPFHNRFALTTEQIIDACSVLNLEPLFQVNTYQFRGRAGNSFETSKVLLAPGNIKQAAAYAARWVKECRNKGYGITWWEIGNEDWIYWTGQQYAAIVNIYAKAMKEADPDIRIVAQGFTGRIEKAFNTADGEEWMPDFIEHVDKDLVDALSIHMYYSGQRPKQPTSLKEQTASLLAMVDDARHVRFVRDLLDKYKLNWQVWITEFNVFQSDENGPGGIQLMQNMAHGLAVANFIGSALELGIDRVGVHALTGHPCFQFLDLTKWTTPDNPKYTVPGLAVQAFTRNFGNEILKVDVVGNPSYIKAEFWDRVHGVKAAPMVEHDYSPLAVYAARNLKEKTVTVVLINRDLDQSISVSLSLADIKLCNKTITERQLGNDLPLKASNITEPNLVQWNIKQITKRDLSSLYLAPHTITSIVIPIEIPKQK